MKDLRWALLVTIDFKEAGICGRTEVHIHFVWSLARGVILDESLNPSEPQFLFCNKGCANT